MKISFVLATALLVTACNAKFGSNGGSAPSQSANPTPPTVQQQYAPPVQPHISNYSGQTLNPHTALQGMGRWIVIDGQQFFVPDLSQSGNDWEPYENGYWSYDPDQDWTWVSNDRWGGITSHYGLWRHHKSHGWIWMAFPDMRYQPHCVTWFDESEYVGWYPYCSNYQGYARFGENLGFNDGYWNGYQSVLSYNSAGFSFRLGITMVSRVDITHPNIRLKRIKDRGLIFRIAHISHGPDRIRLGRVGRIPGGDRSRSHDFLQKWAPHQKAPVGRAREVVTRGGARIMQPHHDKDKDRRDSRSDSRDSVRREDRRPETQQPRREETRRTETQPRRQETRREDTRSQQYRPQETRQEESRKRPERTSSERRDKRDKKDQRDKKDESQEQQQTQQRRGR